MLCVQLFTMIFPPKKPQISPSKKPYMTLLDFLALCVFCLSSFPLFSTTSCLLMQIIKFPTSVLVIASQSFLVHYFTVSSSALVSVFLCMCFASLSHSLSLFWSHQSSSPNFCKSWVFLWVCVCRFRRDYCWLLIIHRIHFPVHSYSQIN